MNQQASVSTVRAALRFNLAPGKGRHYANCLVVASVIMDTM